MSLEAALEANTAALAVHTAALKELTAALLAAGALQTAQASAAAHASPAVQAVVKAQKEADAKKSARTDTSSDANATSVKSGEQTANESKLSGEASASEAGSAPTELHPWHEKTAKLFAELDGAEPTFDNLRKAVLGINQQIGRAQAEAVLQRFGADAITPKADKVGLNPEQYADVFAMCLRVLAGRVDATLSMTE